MRKILVVLMIIMIAILSSCASEEEKEMKASRDKYEDVIDGFVDILKDSDDLSANDIKEMNDMASEYKTKIKDAESLETIDENGKIAIADFCFMSMFVLSEDDFMGYLNKVVEEYPDLKSYLM